MEHAFGRSEPFSLGVEEELLLVDERSLELVAAGPDVIAAADGIAKAELMASFVETTTGICASPAEAASQLHERRREIAEVASRSGLRVVAVGSHPFSRAEDQPITDNPDYLEFVEATGPAARRQAVCGLHVHIGMPDPDTCVRAHEAALPWLPVVLALSANSPWIHGVATGLMSNRAEILATLPRAGGPPPFASFAEWESMIERWIRAGVLKKPTSTWWDARVHPALGTLEIRAPDQPTDAAIAGAFIALLHALGIWAAAQDGGPASRADYDTNRFFASRFGPRAELVHPYEDRLVPVPELYAELVALVRPDAELVAPLDPARCEADLQLEARDARAACAAVVERSLASPA
jgi:glutamate---cysteine ligase / carboxylate-amine ligase